MERVSGSRGPGLASRAQDRGHTDTLFEAAATRTACHVILRRDSNRLFGLNIAVPQVESVRGGPSNVANIVQELNQANFSAGFLQGSIF